MELNVSVSNVITKSVYRLIFSIAEKELQAKQYHDSHMVNLLWRQVKVILRETVMSMQDAYDGILTAPSKYYRGKNKLAPVSCI